MMLTSIKLHYDAKVAPPKGRTRIYTIPPVIWNAGLIFPDKTSYAEGAIVHAQLLSRSVDASKEVPSIADMAATIQSIRKRIWSIPLEKAAMQAVYDLICDVIARVPDPLSRAAIFMEIFYGQHDDRKWNTGPPKELARLSNAAFCLYRALAYTAWRLNRGDYNEIMHNARPKVTMELMASLGADAVAMRRAMEIDRGFDLITVAATIRWLRDIQQGEPEFEVNKSNYSWSASPTMTFNQLKGIYGWNEVANPVLRKTNERYLAAAISRMTQYKKGVQKRQKK